ncbi:hypothetical protein RJT34_08225 [Clitoria ternatea]|uniref:GED domain-containing protein n=1 Tax=Clitoria ternatea TaxID=43366 RepID=A0AAN9K3I0_CLITE
MREYTHVKLSGRRRSSNIETYAEAELPPLGWSHFDKYLSMDNMRKLITEPDGYQPHLVAPEQGYRHLIESCLVSIRGPAEAAVDAVHGILKDLIQKSMSETMASHILLILSFMYIELKQYPTLKVELGSAAIDSLERMREESKKATLLLVDMECGYLTVEFFRKLPQDAEKGGNPTQSLFDRYNDSYLRRIATTVLSYVNMVCGSLRHTIPKSVVYCQVREAKLTGPFLYKGKQLASLLNEDPTVMQRRTSLARRLEL